MNGQPMRHAFVRSIPEKLEPEMLYVSLDYFTTSHLCACGCGAEVVLPLHPTKWRMTFDGAAVSMAPSVGSRTLPCRSHYWIDRGQVRWANRMSDDDFLRALERDQRDDNAWHNRHGSPANHAFKPEQGAARKPASPAPTHQTRSNASVIARTLSVLKRFFKF
jgi:hypothetical protein